MTRQLPPLATDQARHQAAHVQADKLVAYLREQTLMVEAWGGISEWEHFIDSAGGVTSERQGEPK